MARAAKQANIRSTKDVPLPGLGDKGIEEIDQAAASYLDVMGRRVDLSKLETEANATVVEVMKKHKKTYYNSNGIEVTIKEGKVKAAVKYEGSGGE